MGQREKLRAVENEGRESITITNEFLSNKTIFMAMGDLLKGYYSQYTAYQLEKLSRRLNQAQKVFANESEVIIRKYTHIDEKTGQPKRRMEAAIDQEGKPIMEKDKDGNEVPKMIPVDFDWKPITEKNDQGEEITTPGNELAEIEFANLGEKTTTFDIYKFDRNEFAAAKLTVAQWMSLNCIFANPYVDEEALKEI